MGWWPFGGGQPGASGALSPAGQALAQQIDMMDRVFDVAVRECGRKCIAVAHREAEFTKGEAVCVKRCALKLFDALDVVGEQLAAVGGALSSP